jgi:hypothetical protein
MNKLILFAIGNDGGVFVPILRKKHSNSHVAGKNRPVTHLYTRAIQTGRSHTYARDDGLTGIHIIIMPLSEFEKQVAQRIQRNKQVLQNLGLPELKEALDRSNKRRKRGPRKPSEHLPKARHQTPRLGTKRNYIDTIEKTDSYINVTSKGRVAKTSKPKNTHSNLNPRTKVSRFTSTTLMVQNAVPTVPKDAMETIKAIGLDAFLATVFQESETELSCMVKSKMEQECLTPATLFQYVQVARKSTEGHDMLRVTDVAKGLVRDDTDFPVPLCFRLVHGCLDIEAAFIAMR